MSNEELVEELIPVASRLAGLVRDRDQPGVQHVLAKLPPHHKDGLLVVLAGMVNPERTPEQLLAWLHQPGISADEAAANRARLAEAIGEVDQERRTRRDRDVQPVAPAPVLPRQGALPRPLGRSQRRAAAPVGRAPRHGGVQLPPLPPVAHRPPIEPQQGERVTRQHHPVADLFPMLPDDELKDLATDIAERGLLQAIVLDSDGRILDGRNRYAACEIASVEPTFETYNGGDPDGYALAVNIARRHLNKGQIAMVTARSEVLIEKQSQRELAASLAVNQSYLSNARTVLDYAPDLADNVVNGDIPLNDAYKNAQERKREAEELKAKRNRLGEHAPDLLTHVEEERMAIDDAIAALDAREEKARREEEERLERERREEEERRAKLQEQQRREEIARQQALNLYSGAVDGLTSALSYAQAYQPPDDMPDNYVSVDTFIKRVETLLDLAKKWSTHGQG